MRLRRGAQGCVKGRDVGIGQPVFEGRADGARLFQRLRAAEAAADRWRRRHPAVRTRAPAPFSWISATQITGNHTEISRSNDPGVEALEIRYRLDGRGVPQGCQA